MSLIYKIFEHKWFKYFLLFIFCLFLTCLSKEYDYDLYARLFVGENILKNGYIFFKDVLSYTPTHFWYDHEYGAGIVFYITYKYFGVFGFILLQTVIMFFTGYFMIKTQRLTMTKYPILLVFMSVFFVFYAHLNPSLVRSHIFSLLFTAIFLYILEIVRKNNNSALIWLIPPITVLWNNLHGGVVAGIGIVFLYIVGSVIERKPFKKLLCVFILSVILLVINPYGWKYLIFLLKANTMHRNYITEWWSVFAYRNILYYGQTFSCIILSFAMILINIFNKVRKKRYVDITKLIVLIVTSVLGIIHVKLLSLSIIIIFALYYHELVKLFDKKKICIMEKISYVIILICICYIPFTAPLSAKTAPYKFPVKEVEFIKINNLRGNLLTEFGIGSYTIYKLYPNNLIYMDGRYETVYNDYEFNNLMQFDGGTENWQKVLTDYPTDICMIMKSVSGHDLLLQSKEWARIYEGPVCSVFIKRDKIKKTYLQPSDDGSYYKKNEFVHNNWE